MEPRQRFTLLVRGFGRSGVASVVSLFVLAALVAFPQPGLATHEPADKVAGAGSRMQQFGPGTNVTLLTELIKTSTPVDLIISVTAECAIFINTVNVPGVDFSFADAQVGIWVEIDGVAVPLTAAPDGASSDPLGGRVVFCNMTKSRTTVGPVLLSEFDQARHANGFNWLKLNVGNGTHTITVKADLVVFTPTGDTAQAVVMGKTLIVQATHLSTHQDMEEQTP